MSANRPISMHALVHRRFGSPDALSIESMERPVPGKEEVLVKVHAAALNPLDWHMLRGTPRIIRLSAGRGRAMRPGRDVAGEVEATGPGVERLRVGDSVFGACQGAFADYVCGTQDAFTLKPSDLSFEDAAAIPIAGLTALQGLRDAGRIRSGHRVLVNGAAGGVGTFAIQIAKGFGAEVTAVCSAGAAELVRGLGADRIIDYGEADFTRGERTCDLILDMVGNRSFRALRRRLAPGGRVVAVGGGGPQGRRLGRWLVRALGTALASRFSRRKAVFFVSRLDLEDLAWLAERAADGRIRPVIGGRYPLERAAEAFEDLVAGHARGKILLLPGGTRAASPEPG